EGELILRPEFVSNPMLGGNYLRELGALARADFGRARSAADRFAQPETRLMARLLVAEGVLAKDTENANEIGFGRAVLMLGR
ncbi:MAG: hypothetical protein H0V88_11675, partial [Pyrinomonadaceae bacterium]|nr:hypothetical protein [Pyrinomonadaceae bacterium]